MLVLVTLVLPWYSRETASRGADGAISHSGGSLSGLAGMTFIAASLLVVLVGVFALLWGRGTGRRFALPYGDGALVCAASGWMGALIVYRLFARPSGASSGQEVTLVGLNWGVFVSLIAVGALFAAGLDLRRHGPRNAIPGDPGPPQPDEYPAVDPATMVVRPRPDGESPTEIAPVSRPDGDPTQVVPASRPDDQPTRVVPASRPDDQPTRVVPTPPAETPAEPPAAGPRPTPPAPPPADRPRPPAPERRRERLWEPIERRQPPVRRHQDPPRPAAPGDANRSFHGAWPSQMRRAPRPEAPDGTHPDPEERRGDAPDERG